MIQNQIEYMDTLRFVDSDGMIRLSPKDIDTIISDKADSLNRGLDPYTILANTILTVGSDQENDADPDDYLHLESRLFTYFVSVNSQLSLDSAQDMLNFIGRLLLIEMSILSHFRPEDSNLVETIKSLTTGKSFKPVNIDEDNEAVVFTSPEANYAMSIKVRKSTGFREGFINDSYLFTRSGPLLMSDILTLIQVINKQL